MDCTNTSVEVTCTMDPAIDPAVAKAVAAFTAAREKRNKAFNRLSHSKQRVQIAQDVLEQIRLGRITPKVGYWMNARADKHGKVLLYRSTKAQLDEALEAAPKCNACALGGIFAAVVKRRNAFTVKQLDRWSANSDEIPIDLRSGHTILNYLEDIFDREQLKLIEVAFERGRGGYSVSEFGTTWQKIARCAKNFAPKTRGAVKRMSHIMRNIIRNGGTFRPEQKPTPGDRRFAAGLLAATRRR